MRPLRPTRLEALRPTAALPSMRGETSATGAVGRRAVAPGWRALAKPTLAIWASARGAALLLTLLAALLSHAGIGPAALLDHWRQWDAGWYVAIASHGYFNATAAGFFPLYPLLIALFALPLGGNSLLAALLVANLGSLAGTFGIGLLASAEDGTATASTRAMLAMAAYPLAFYLIAPYSEGLFLAFAIFALYCARRGQWRWAAVCAALAGLTRPTSIALVLPLVWEYGRQHGWWTRVGWQAARSWRVLGGAALALGALPAALVAYALFCWVRFGDPLLYTRAQSANWHHVSMVPWATLWLMLRSALNPPASDTFRLLMVVDYGAFFAVAALTVWWARRIPLCYTLYMLGLLALLLTAPVPSRPEVVVSSARYLLTAFPIFLIASRWMKGRPRVSLVLLGVGVLLQAAFMVWFLTGHWIE